MTDFTKQEERVKDDLEELKKMYGSIGQMIDKKEELKEIKKDYEDYSKGERLSQLILVISSINNSTKETIFGGQATSRNTITPDDTFGSYVLKKMSVLFGDRETDEERTNRGDIICLIHPYQQFDLLNDADWVAASRYIDTYASAMHKYIGTFMDIHVLSINIVPKIEKGLSPGIKAYKSIAVRMPSSWTEKMSADFNGYLYHQILYADYIQTAETSVTDLSKE